MIDLGQGGRRASGGHLRCTGISLVELIVAVCILGFVFGLIIELVPFSHVANRKAWDANTAQEIANSQMETLRAFPFDNLPAAAGTFPQTIKGTDFVTVVTVAPYRDPKFMSVVTVDVTWMQNGGQQELVAQSLIVKGAP